MRRIVFDIETRDLIYPDKESEVAVVGVYDSETDQYKCYQQEDLNDLWPILEQADMLIGFTSDHFDIPLLNRYYPGDLTKFKSLDILREIKKSYGRRMKLDQIAEGTLGIKKSGNGLEAVVWWKKGEIDKVKNYCIDDVRITKELYDYARANNKLFFTEGGKKIEIPLDATDWESLDGASITHTLPF